MRYRAPDALDEALAALSAEGARVLAGGTDIYPALRDAPLAGEVVDISRIAALKSIQRVADGWRIGAAATWSDVLRAGLPPAFDGLCAAAREVGGVQVQNAGTIVGNLCNASPAADGVPPLLTLDAMVEIASATARREMPLAGFITGVRQTALAPGEMVTGLRIPAVPEGTRGRFLKLGARRYLVISIAMVAVLIVPEDGMVASARVAVGACSAVARRLPGLEAALAGRPLAALAKPVDPAHLAPLSPIDDVRAGAGYRLEAAAELIRRALAGLGS